MRIAQVPGLRAAIVHDAVITFGGGDEARVLRSIEEALPVLLRVLELLRKERSTLIEHRLLALAIAPSQHRAAIGRGLLLPGRQTTVALPRDDGCTRINLVEIVENRGDRAAHVVEVQ